MSNMKGVNEALSRTCSGSAGRCSDGREHASCTGKRAEQAAIYPLKLCRAILSGIQNHLQSTGWMSEDAFGVMVAAEEVMKTEELNVAEGTRRMSKPQTSQHGGRTYDVLTRQLIDEELVIQGKLAETAFIGQWKVYEYADYEEAYAETGRKPISTRWACTSKVMIWFLTYGAGG